MIGFDNLFISLRPATPADNDFAYQVKKVALGEYVKKMYGRWDEVFQRTFHDRQRQPAGTQIVVASGTDVGWVWCTAHSDHISVDGIYLLPQYQSRGIGTWKRRHSALYAEMYIMCYPLFPLLGVLRSGVSPQQHKKR